MFWRGSIVLLDVRQPMAQGLGILFDVAFPAAVGGIFGIFERAYLGLPPALLLGPFGSPVPVRGTGRFFWPLLCGPPPSS